jgi:hypothetical protein
MSLKKRPGKELLTEHSSQVAGAHILKTATQPQTSLEPYPATVETRRPKEPLHQPATQAEAPTMNTFAPNTEQPTQHQEIEAQEDQQQDLEEEIEAVIKDELARLR